MPPELLTKLTQLTSAITPFGDKVDKLTAQLHSLEQVGYVLAAILGGILFVLLTKKQ